MQQLSPYASRVTLSLRHAALESLPQGHDQAASSAVCECCCRCSTCMLASGRRCSAWSPAPFVRQREHIGCSRRTRVDRGEENALDAFRHAAGYWCRRSQELSSFRVGSRVDMHVLSCTTALLRYMHLRYQDGNNRRFCSLHWKLLQTTTSRL